MMFKFTFFVCQSLNQVVLWDQIVLRGDSTVLNMNNKKSKYFFFDDGNGLRLFIYLFTAAADIMECSDAIS